MLLPLFCAFSVETGCCGVVWCREGRFRSMYNYIQCTSSGISLLERKTDLRKGWIVDKHINIPPLRNAPLKSLLTPPLCLLTCWSWAQSIVMDFQAFLFCKWKRLAPVSLVLILDLVSVFVISYLKHVHIVVWVNRIYIIVPLMLRLAGLSSHIEVLII